MRNFLKKIAFIIVLILLNIYGNSIQAQEQDVNLPDFQRALNQKFKAGVNISFFENYWKKEDDLLENYKKVMSKIALADKLGFTSVRLPVAFDNFLVSGTNTNTKELIDELVEIYEYVEKRNMNLVITYHYGTLFKKENKVREVERIADMWSQIVFNFKGRGYDRLYFGLYNEPRVSVEDWRYAKNNLIKMFKYFIQHYVKLRFN